MSSIRRQAVVPPSWVHDLVGGGSPLTYPGHGFVTLEVGWGEPDAYLRGHVPGAAYLGANLIERPPLWHFVPDAELQTVLERFGITRWAPVSGGHRTVKVPALVAVPALVVTVMCPVVVPAATVAVIVTAELTT